MIDYTFNQLVDGARVQQLLESLHRVTGMAHAVLDNEGIILAAAGWQDICVRFYRRNPVSCKNCRESDAFIKAHLHNLEGDFLEYRCKNGMMDVAMPIIIDGKHLATFFTGQFFYADNLPETESLLLQAEALGFDPEEYLKALKQVPQRTRKELRDTMLLMRDILNLQAETGVNKLMFAREVEERKQREAALREENEFFQMLLNAIPVPAFYKDKDGCYLGANKSFEEFLGKPQQDLIGKCVFDVAPRELAEICHARDLELLQRCGSQACQLQMSNAQGVVRDVILHKASFTDPKGRVCGLIGVVFDISESLSFQEQLHNLAFYDTLTELPNRALLYERLRQSMSEAVRHEQCVGLMLLDLDHFKMVNDTLGHSAGDRLLCEVVARIRECVRDYDTVARLGGDEFAIVLPDVRHEEDMGAIARKIINVFLDPFFIEGIELFVTASIGITCYPLDGHDMDELMQHADTAMYHAKSQGKNCFQFYSTKLSAHVEERVALENGLRRAIIRDELELYYQPKIELSTGALTGAEALLRWNHPERGMMMPNSFMSIAEETGLIVVIGEWVLRNACLTARKWNERAVTPLKIAVNLSSRQFTANDLVGTIRCILEETGCRAEWLEIEMSESLLQNNPEDIQSILDALSLMGISLTIDDFGTVYSALGYLTRFPINTLKIDRSFVSAIRSNPESAELVRAVASLSNSLHMGLVAEGVETTAQAVYLNNNGCCLAQGYLFGKPMPSEQFESFVVDKTFLNEGRSARNATNYEEAESMIQGAFQE